MKVCKGCRIEKDESEFGTRHAEVDLLNIRCRFCVNKMSRAYREKIGVLESREKANNYRKRNRDMLRRKARAYYHKHREACAAKARHYRKNNAEHRHGQRLQEAYGITKSYFERLKQKQDNVCAVCKRPERKKLRGELCRLSLDHDHKSGKIRGLLCNTCNRGIGLLGDSLIQLQAAVRYLKKAARRSK